MKGVLPTGEATSSFDRQFRCDPPTARIDATAMMIHQMKTALLDTCSIKFGPNSYRE